MALEKATKINNRQLKK